MTCYQALLLPLLVAQLLLLRRLRAGLREEDGQAAAFAALSLALPLNFLTFFFHERVSLGRGGPAQQPWAYALALAASRNLRLAAMAAP